MIYAMDDLVEILKFANEVVGMEKNIIIDSGIFKHNIFDDDNVLDESADIIKIRGSRNNPICFNDVINAFKKMVKQFRIINIENLDDRTYAYEGITYNKNKSMYEIHWGS